MTQPSPANRWQRRQFLALTASGSAAFLLAGCAPSPLIIPDAGRSPMPAPTLDDQRRSAAQEAATLAALAGAIAAIPGADVGFSAWCAALAEQHLAHLTVLGQADPLGGVQADHTPLEQISPAPLTLPANPAEAMAVLAGEERRLAESLAPMVHAVDQTSSMALLWISQRLAAQVAAGALEAGVTTALGPAPIAGGAVPAETEAGDLPTARQVLLTHQQALVFGLQSMLGQVRFDDPLAGPLEARLGEAMRERDLTAAAITASGATPSPPAPGYALPANPPGPIETPAAWGRLELAVLAGWARVAAVDPTGREEASVHAFTQAMRTRGLGEPLPYWPGWV